MASRKIQNRTLHLYKCLHNENVIMNSQPINNSGFGCNWNSHKMEKKSLYWNQFTKMVIQSNKFFIVIFTYRQMTRLVFMQCARSFITGCSFVETSFSLFVTVLCVRVCSVYVSFRLGRTNRQNTMFLFFVVDILFRFEINHTNLHQKYVSSLKLKSFTFQHTLFCLSLSLYWVNRQKKIRSKSCKLNQVIIALLLHNRIVALFIVISFFDSHTECRSIKMPSKPIKMHDMI